MKSSPPRPGVSVFLTVRNEAAHLEQAVDRIFGQAYPGPLEVVMAVGPSDDDTAAVAGRLAERYPALRTVPNPSGRTPQGLNLAWRAATHEYLIRVDGHSLLPAGYIERAVELLESTGAANVGGLMVPEGTRPFQRAVARAMSSPFGIGAESFHTGGRAGPAKSVYLGSFRRRDLEEVGGFNEDFARAQDWELNHRLIAAGKLVWFDPRLGVVYRPRGTWASLGRQFYATGRWRWRVIKAYPGTASARYLAPPLVTLAVAAGLATGLFGMARRSGSLAAVLALPGLYAAGVTAAAGLAAKGLDRRTRAWLPVVMATMHMAWGAGFLRAIGEGWSPGQPSRPS
ncbi:MAG: glycosyltransferase family 2 protein [Bifidobacteriaceae bacterium]|nr:glycosyltransferase family 2 protein [Bifidobacteriaceae bacterium]